MQNPFDVLFPELWGEIRSHLSQEWDATDRICLQRTCKEAYRLDPGPLMAGGWARLIQQAEPYQEPSIRTLMKQVQQTQLLYQSWFPGIAEIVAVGLDIEMGLRPSRGLLVELRYDPAAPSPWGIRLVVRETTYKFAHFARTLDELLLKVPCLGFHRPLDAIHEWGRAGRLAYYLAPHW